MTRHSRWLPLLLALFLPPCADAQTALPQSFEQSVLGTDVLPRGFPGEAKVQYRWQRNGLALDPEPRSTLGVLTVESVKVKREHGAITEVTIKGKRRTLVGIAADNLQPSGSTTKVTLTADLHDATADALSHLEATLFYPDRAAMLADLPPTFPGNPAIMPRSEDSQGRIDKSGPGQHVDTQGTHINGVVPPQVTHTVTPDYSREARRTQIDGDVLVGLTIDTEGRPANLWLLSPLGFGLDEKAMDAVEKYRFSPARYQNQPISVVMNVKVNFRIF